MKRLLIATAVLASTASPRAVPQEAAPPPDEAAAILQEAQSGLRLLNRLSDALPREPLEPADLVDHVLGGRGGDAEGLAQWVASSVGWLPYRGALRGPRGVLIERRGNSLDQSLLLGASLAELGLEVRLARAELDEPTATAMHAALASAEAARTGATEDAGDAEQRGARELTRAAEILGVDREVLRAAHEALTIQAQECLERVVPTTLRQTRELRALLAEGGVVAEAAPEALRAEEVQALRDHWWVQAREEDGSWSDFDPLALRSGLGLAVEPAATCAIDELPAEWRHLLRLRVVAEQLGPEGRRTHVALAQEFAADTLAGSYFSLAFRPMHPEQREAPGPGEEDSGAALLRFAAAESEWLPVLSTVDHLGRARSEHQSSIRTDGTLDEEPDLDTSTRKVGSAIAALGPAGEASESELTAVWIEYELVAPGRRPEVVQRSLFDLLGEARRRSGAVGAFEVDVDLAAARGLALSGQSQVLPATCALSADFAFRLDLFNRIRNQRVLVQLASDIVEGNATGLADAAAELASPPLDLVALAQMRLGAGRFSDRVFLGSTNLFANHFQPVAVSPERRRALRERGLQAEVVYARAIDIVANPVGVLATSGEESSVSAWDVRLEQGVLDTVLETVALPDLGSGATSAGDGRDAVHNTSTWMERHPAAGWNVVVPGAELDVAESDMRARAAEALERGHVAVLPGGEPDGDAAAGPGCWWSVEAATGRTLGIGPRGWGQTMLEAAETEAEIAIKNIEGMRRFFATKGCLFFQLTVRVAIGINIGALTGALGGMTGHPVTSATIMGYGMAYLADKGITGAFAQLIQYSCQYLVAVA